MTDVWISNDNGTEIVRARDVAVAGLDYDGNVTVRLAGGDGAVVTIAGRRAHHDEHRPDDFHRQLIRAIAELSDAAGTFLVRAVHDEARGWQRPCTLMNFPPPVCVKPGTMPVWIP